MYYFLIRGEKIAGIAQCYCQSENIQCLAVSQEQYQLADEKGNDYFLFKEGGIVINPRYEAEQAQKEAERIALLNLTAADVERAIYKAKGIDFDDVISMIEAMPLSEGQTPSVDIKALKIELKANNFYRGNPYIDTVGTLLGFTKQQLDEFFETNDYTKLLPPAEEDTSSPSGISGVSPNAPEENEGVNNGVNDSEAPETPAAPTSYGETEEVEG